MLNATENGAGRPLRALMLYLDATRVYAEDWPDVEALPPNFYQAAAERVFPAHNIECVFPPSPDTLAVSHWLRRIAVPRQIAFDIALIVWILTHCWRFDVVIGWHGPGAAVALIRGIFKWRRPRVCLILYRLYNPVGAPWKVRAKHLITRLISRGTDLLLAVSADQARAFEHSLARRPGATRAFVYGVDTSYFRSKRPAAQPDVEPRLLFCPGSPGRDETLLRQAVENLDVTVLRFRLAHGISQATGAVPTEERVGRSMWRTYTNAPYEQYLRSCLRAAAVVLPVKNDDAPMGLTALLECMSLGKAVIISDGYSSRDYVTDTVSAFTFKYGDATALSDVIGDVLDRGDRLKDVSQAAADAASQRFGLERCGAGLGDLVRLCAVSSQ